MIEILRAVEENPEGFYRNLAKHTKGAFYRRDEHYRAMYFSSALSIFNGIAMVNATEQTADSIIGKALDEMTEAAVPWRWQLGPMRSPQNLEERVIQQGFHLNYTTPAMVLDVSTGGTPPNNPPELEICAVQNAGDLDEWGEVCHIGFGLPEIAGQLMVEGIGQLGFGKSSSVACFTGYADGDPICTSCAYFENGVAGIYCVTTLEAGRGKGFGSAITSACLREAAERGMEKVILHSSTMGLSVYEKLGFREVCKLSFLS